MTDFSSATASFEAHLVSSTLKIFHDEEPRGEAQSLFRMTAVRNEYAPFQVAVTAAEDIVGVSVKFSGLVSRKHTIPAVSSSLYLVENVTTEKPSIAATRKVWPDPLPPYHDFNVAAGTTRVVWIDLFVPAGTPPGMYKGTVTVSAGREAINMPLILEVKDILLPDKPTLKTAFGIIYHEIRKAHRLAENSPEEKPLFDAYYWFLVKHRLSPYRIPVDFFSVEAHRYLDDPRVTFLRAPFSRDKTEMQRIADRLKSTGWINKAVFYVIDEPSPDEFAEVNRIGEWIHSFNPNLKYLITNGYTPAFDAAGIQIWCPGFLFLPDPTGMQGLRREMKRGKEFWWYTCSVPKWKGMNYLIDEYATAPRLQPWMNYLYGVTGILYWQTTYWQETRHNPWAKTETTRGSNGNGSLLYPGYPVGYNGPVASIRLKMLREGIEDYELLHLLGESLRPAARRIGGAALEYNPDARLYEHAFALVSPEGRMHPLGRNTTYLMFVTTDYREIERERAKVITEIEQALIPPVALIATDPLENGFTRRAHASVKGYVEPGSKVYVNEKPVTVKGKVFVADVALKSGKNVVGIIVRRGDRAKTIERIIYRK